MCTGTLPKCSAQEPTDWRNERGMESRRLFAMGARGEEPVVRYIMEQRYIGIGISSSFIVIFFIIQLSWPPYQNTCSVCASVSPISESYI